MAAGDAAIGTEGRVDQAPVGGGGAAALCVSGLKLLYAFEQDHFDAHIQSGRPYQLRQALAAAGHEIVDAPNLVRLGLDGYRLKQAAWKLFGRIERGDRDPRRLKGVAARMERLFAVTGCDAIVSPSTLPVAYVSPDVPIYLVVDAIFSFNIDRYDSFSNLTARYRRDGEATDRAALSRARGVVVPTALLADAVVATGLIAASRVRVRPWGPNLRPGRPDALADGAERRRAGGQLLFVGREWRRKGFDLLMDALRCEAGSGLRCLVLGMRARDVPPRLLRGVRDRVVFLGELRLSDAEARARAQAAYLDACLMVAPTRAENFGIAFVEALGFALPLLAFDIDGLGDSFGRSGAVTLLPRTAAAVDFAAAAAAILADASAYAGMSKAALACSDDFSWASVAMAVGELMGGDRTTLRGAAA